MLSVETSADMATGTGGLPTSAYIHIPFCRRRCFYCDFPVAVVGDRRNGSNSGTIAHYVDVLCQEIQQAPGASSALKTVFFGGGTPSLLTVEQVQRILEVLGQQFGIAPDAEISMEIDPGTFDLPQVAGYAAAGVNRISLGVQAFQPELLQACGRSHTVEQIEQAIAHVRQAGVQNISLDLISGLPHQTIAHWQESLERAIGLNPTHLSCYDLTVEPATPFARQYQPGTAPLPSDEATAEMYRTAQRLLTAAGYQHYEISNYAKPGYPCRHNRTYWENRPFYGFGMGATSYLNRCRVSRPRKTREYYEWVAAQTGAVSNNPDAEPDDRTSELLDTLMLGLRLAEGLDLAELGDRFGSATLRRIWKCLQPYAQKGWAALEPNGDDRGNAADYPTAGRLRFTDPEGFLFSNVMLTRLFQEFE